MEYHLRCLSRNAVSLINELTNRAYSSIRGEASNRGRTVSLEFGWLKVDSWADEGNGGTNRLHLVRNSVTKGGTEITVAETVDRLLFRCL